MDGTVLVADDDRTIRTVLTQALTRAGCRVHATSSLVTLKRWVAEGKGDLVISDVGMPDGNGLETVPEIAALRPGLPVIIISAQNTIMTAIKAAEAEAFDYLPKPFDLPDLMKRAARALEVRPHAPPSRSDAQQAGASAEDALPLVGRTPQMQALYRLVARIVNSDLPVLISGASGVGKSLIARAIHDFSDRRGQPFVVASAADLTPLEGPATVFARARGGALVLDEVGDLSLETQGRVVRLLDGLEDTGPRVLAATQANLAPRMQAGQFRQDLFYRLSGVSVTVPALRDRVDDIPLLAAHFLAAGARPGAPVHSLSKNAMALLRGYSWPGNVRQLENVIRRLLVTATAPELRRAEVETVLYSQPESEVIQGAGDGERPAASVDRHLRRYFDLHGGALPAPGLYQRILREIERPLIELSLDATAGNQARCADLLGINRNTLRKKIAELDIQVTRRRKLM